MNPIEKLITLFEHFPGIGPRQARRFVHYLLGANPALRAEIAESVRNLGAHASRCKKCFRWFVNPVRGKTSVMSAGESRASNGMCSICSDTHRDAGLLFVVEKDADIEPVERSGFKGLYFCLGGTVPLAAEAPEKYIREKELLKRIEQDGAEKILKEIILGLSATTEGDHTRLLLQEKILPIAGGLKFKISSLGRGLSTGSELEYADPETIANALNSRN